MDFQILRVKGLSRPLSLGAVLVSALVLSACGGGSNDPYKDPGTPPPATITDPTINTSGSIAPKAGSADLMEINVAGFAAPASRTRSLGDRAQYSLPELDVGDFTVVELGTVKGITVERIGADRRAAADIVFVFDTTGSMGSALTSVQNSIIEFVDFLDESGLDVRVGAVTFGDAFDTLSTTSTRTGGASLTGLTAPGFDSSERPTFRLSSNFERFRKFISEDSARGGGDAAENALGALEFAYDEMSWRDGAQKIVIVIMDIYSHNRDSFSTFGDSGLPWLPPRPNALLERMRGNATVHVIAPSTEPPSGFTNMRMFAGASGTGGVFVNWNDSFGSFDLTELPIAAAAAGGYIITFRGTKDGEEKDVRVVIDNGDDIRGEFTIKASY